MTIPVLPLPPSTLQPANFRARGDEFFTALFDFAAECNVFSTQFLSAVTDVNNAVVASLWATGAYVAGNRVYDPTNGLLYLCILNHTGTAAQYPSTQPTRWALMSMTAPPLTVHSGATSTGSPYALVKAQHVEISNTSQSWAQLPASPTVGDWVWLGFVNARYDNVVKRNSQPIMGVAEDMTVNKRYATLLMRYTGASFGWKVLVL